MRLCLGVMKKKKARDEECSMWIYLIWLWLTNATCMYLGGLYLSDIISSLYALLTGHDLWFASVTLWIRSS